MEYKLIRSTRKTLAIEITQEAELLVRAPMKLSVSEIERFLASRHDWIQKHTEIQKLRVQKRPVPTTDEIPILIARAHEILPQKVTAYGAIMGVCPTGIRITGAKKRFGSCSGKNSLCFSYLLVAYPEEAIDYVVVHELAHILHHDHSRAFWQTVESYLPDYKKRQKILKGQE